MKARKFLATPAHGSPMVNMKARIDILEMTSWNVNLYLGDFYFHMLNFGYVLSRH